MEEVEVDMVRSRISLGKDLFCGTVWALVFFFMTFVVVVVFQRLFCLLSRQTTKIPKERTSVPFLFFFLLPR